MLRLALVSLALGALALGGCSKSRTRGGDVTPGMRVDAGPDDDPPRVGTGATYTYVIHVLNIGQADPAGDPNIVPGFDLDRRVSNEDDPEGCFHLDFVSPPPDSERGVDNQWGPILASVGSSLDIEGSIQASIQRGELILLVRLSGVGDTRADDAITAELLEGVPASGTPTLDPTGGLAPGQTFVAGRSITAATGRIAAGRALLGFSELALAVPLMGPSSTGAVSTTMRDGELRFDVAPDELRLGVMGGALDVEETVIAIVASAPDDIPESLARSILEGQADLAPDAMGNCREISNAMVFEAVTAVIAE
jgi:hypothetical protein